MLSSTSSKQLKEHHCTTCALVIMRRPRRAGLGVLSPRRAPNLGKVRRRSCLRLILLPGTGDVLLAPTMISHPLAYVAPNPQHGPTDQLNPWEESCLLDVGCVPLIIGHGRRRDPMIPNLQRFKLLQKTSNDKS